MGIVIDGVIILFILISVFLGYRKGLVSLGIHLVAFIVALVIAFILYRPIGSLIMNTTEIDESLQGTIETKLEEIVGNDDAQIVTNSIIGDIQSGAISETSRSLSMNIIYGATIIVLFIILRIALVFISAIANWIAKLPILKQANKLGGILYGLLRGILITYAILLILNLVINRCLCLPKKTHIYYQSFQIYILIFLVWRRIHSFRGIFS